MGLAASAAQAILVKAQISNLELETQQIQRQKLNLANMSAAIEDKALQMDVPTSPSTYDPKFLTTVYEGTDANGNAICACAGSNGGMEVSVLDKKVPSLTVGQEASSVEKFEQVDIPTRENPSIEVEYAPEVQVNVYKDKNNNYISEAEYNLKQDGDIPRRDTGRVDENGNAIMEDLPEAQQKGYKAYYSQEQVYQRDAANPVTMTVSDPSELPTYSHEHSYVVGGALSTKAEPMTFDLTDAYKWDDCSGGAATLQDLTSTELSNCFKGWTYEQAQEMINAGYCVGDASSARALNLSDFDEYGRLSVDKLFKELEFENVDGHEAYEISEAESKFPDNQNLKEMVDRIKTYISTQNGGIPATNDDLKQWRIIGDGTNFTAIKLETNSDGTSKATKFDNTEAESAYRPAEVTGQNINSVTGAGTITIKGPDGKTQEIAVLKTQKLDAAKYGAAQEKYNQEKAEYDRQQEIFNQETKKLQRIDKQFDMKLERLANERAALEKQLDDLDKVKEDNTEKSFSAFQ